jgi:mannitol 2-dehydrogenase
MSCDNIPENGHVAKRCVLALANALDPALGAWIQANVPFPNTMVDRITPVTTPADIETLADQYGISDGWPVVAEDFMQWVIEENFVDGCRPPFEKVRCACLRGVDANEST